MVTEKQLIANRRNAQLGGVKTAAGKEISRFNAITHGLLTKAVIKTPEEAPVLEQLRNNLTSQYLPEGELEMLLVERIASCIWRLKRVLKLETKAITDDWAWSIEDGHPYTAIAWQGLNRYETNIERQLYKAMHELERVQRLRQGEFVAAPLAVDLDLSAPADHEMVVTSPPLIKNV